MPEGLNQSEEYARQQAVLDQRSRTHFENAPDFDDYDNFVEEAKNESGENLESAETPSESDKEKESRQKPFSAESKNDIIIENDLRSIVEIVLSGQFDDVELNTLLNSVCERFHTEVESEELIKCIQEVDKLLPDNFPQAERHEVVSNFSEIVARNHLDTTTLTALINRIEYVDADDGSADVAHYQPGGQSRRAVILTSKLFEKDENGDQKNDVQRIINHEIGHGLRLHGKVFDDETVQKAVEQLDEENTERDETDNDAVRVIEAAIKNKEAESVRVIEAIKDWEEAKSQADTPEKKTQLDRWVVEEILAEKTGFYLQSDKTFADFLRISISHCNNQLDKYLGVAPEDRNDLVEMHKQITATTSEAERGQILNQISERWPKAIEYYENNQVFWDICAKRLNRKDEVSERVNASIRSADATESGGGGFDSFGEMMGSDLLPERGAPISDGSKKPKVAQGFFSDLKKLFEGIGEEVDPFK